MNTSKVDEYFRPDKSKLYVVGCGSVGSTLAEALARCGCTNFVLMDFDKVESKNLANQAFRASDIGRPKVEALRDIITSINPDAAKSVRIVPEGWTGQNLSGYVFLCVDNIDLRRQIVEKNFRNLNIKAMFDFRTGLTDAQHYAANWKSLESRKRLLDTMQFSHEEAAADTPVSACGVTLGVVTTVMSIVSIGVQNYIRAVKGENIDSIVLLDLGEYFEICAPAQRDTAMT